MEPGRTRGDSISSMIDSLSLNSSKSSSPLRTSPSVQASSSTLPPPVPLVTVPSTLVPPSENSSNSTFVLFQPSCSKHRYIRNHHDLSEIVERPERIKAVTAGIASVWSKHEKLDNQPKWTPPPTSEAPSSAVVEDQDELGILMKGLSIDRKSKRKERARGEIIGKSSPFDILFSDDQLSIDSQALKLIHGVPNYPPSTTTTTTLATSSNTDPPPPPVLKEEEESSSPSRRRSSPRKPPPPPPPSSTSYPTDSPWPSQLLHLIKQIPPEPPTPTSNIRRSFNTNNKSKSNQRRESEIPLHLPQGDLYLSSESDQAIFGALGAVCKGVDLICQNDKQTGSSSSNYKEGFVVVRPPGHHCGESSPQGFCFVNNVAIAAAHAHLEHGIDRVAILDIDLHHGNGTQEIVWQLNEKANKTLMKQQQPSPRKSNSPSKLSSFEKDQDPPRPLQIMYSSLHDVLSYPCESGDQELITSASLQISGPHSQFIQNTHLEPYTSLLDFKERLWEKYWNNLGGEKLVDFLSKTQAKEEETLILVSCGFDCSIHEYSTMSRHGLNVPKWFLKQFSKRIKRVADKYSKGKVLFVLEGGYSDKALVSGSFSVLEGLLLSNSSDEEEEEEEEENLEDLERILQVCGLASNNSIQGSGGGSKKKFSKSGGGGGGGIVKVDDKDWIKRTKEIFDYLQLQQQHDLDETETDDETQASTTDTRSLKPAQTTLLTNTDSGGGGGRQLRERKIKLDYAGIANHSFSLATQQQQQQPQSQQSQQSSTSPPRSVNSQTTGTAFSSIPPASFYPPLSTTTTTRQENQTGRKQEEEEETGGGDDANKEIDNPNPNPPKIKFVWKQGGIGGSNTVGSSSSSMGEPRM